MAVGGSFFFLLRRPRRRYQTECEDDPSGSSHDEDGCIVVECVSIRDIYMYLASDGDGEVESLLEELGQDRKLYRTLQSLRWTD